MSDNTNYEAANEPQKESNGMAIASLVLGIISLVLSCSAINVITAIIAIILGAIHLKNHQTGKKMAIAGLVLGILSIIILVIVVAVGITILSDASLYNELMNTLEQVQ